MADDQESPPPLPERPPSDPPQEDPPDSALLAPPQPRYGRRALAFAFVFQIALILLIGWAMAPELLRPVPEPEELRNFLAAAEATASPATTEDQDSSRSGPAIASDADLPAALALRRDEFNAAYELVWEDLARVEAEIGGLTYGEAYDRLGRIHSANLTLAINVNDHWPKARAADRHPTQRRFIERTGGTQGRLDDLRFENYLRHGRWRMAALDTQRENWDEAVYYWRREGGFAAFWHVGAGGLERRLREKDLMRPLYAWLPYPDLDVLPTSIR